MLQAGLHHHPVRVYYDDTDAGGIVYHATYLRMAERARTEALRELGAPHAELVVQHGLAFVVRRAELDYLAPARLDDALLIETSLEHLGSASLRLRQAFVSQAIVSQAFVSQGSASHAHFNELQHDGNAPTPPLVIVRVSLVCVAGAASGSQQPGRGDEPLRPARIPERWRAALARLQWEGAAPAAEARGPRG